MEKSKSLLTSECVAVEKEIKLNICYLLQCAADHWHCNVSMSILCRGEPVTWKFIISNEHCCTHFVWWWSIITTVQSTIRTIGYSKQRKYFLMQFKKNLRGQTMLHHHAINNNTFSTFWVRNVLNFYFLVLHNNIYHQSWYLIMDLGKMLHIWASLHATLLCPANLSQ